MGKSFIITITVALPDDSFDQARIIRDIEPSLSEFANSLRVKYSIFTKTVSSRAARGSNLSEYQKLLLEPRQPE